MNITKQEKLTAGGIFLNFIGKIMKFLNKKTCILRHVDRKISPAAGYQLLKSQPKIVLITDTIYQNSLFQSLQLPLQNRQGSCKR